MMVQTNWRLDLGLLNSASSCRNIYDLSILDVEVVNITVAAHAEVYLVRVGFFEHLAAVHAFLTPSLSKFAH